MDESGLYFNLQEAMHHFGAGDLREDLLYADLWLSDE